MSKEIFNDLRLYLSGDMKLKEVCAKHAISKYRAEQYINQLHFEAPAGITAYQDKRTNPHDLSIIKDQIAVERRVSAMNAAIQGAEGIQV